MAPRDAGPAGVLSPAFVGRLAGFFFLVAGGATAMSVALPLPQGEHRAAVAAVSVASLLAGLAAWRAPWARWPAAVMRWTVPPAALALIAATNRFGGLGPYTYVVAFPLVFAWVGLSQPRWTSLRLAALATVAYLVPLLAARRPTGELFTAALVIPVIVGLGEGCAWVAARLRAAEGEVRAAGVGIERLLEATTALGRADSEVETAALTAALVMDLLGADRVVVMAAEEKGSSRFVSRGQRNVPVPLGESVVDAATDSPSGTALAVRSGRTLFVPDLASSPLISAHLARLIPSASAAFIPLPGEGGFLGAVVVLWDTPRAGLDPFSQRAAEVLSAEAGRALERTRASARVAQNSDEQGRTVALLRHERLALQLLRVVAVAANEAKTVDDAFGRAIDEICAYAAWPVGHAYLPDPEGVLTPTGLWHLEDAERFESFRRATEETHLRPGVGLLSRVVLSRAPAWVVDVTADPDFHRAAAAGQSGLRGAFALPVLVDGEVVAVLEFFSSAPLEPDESMLELARQVGTQLGRVVERHRSEETLRASEERVRAVIDTAGDAFIGMDADGIVTEWNHEAQATFGWSRAEVLGLPVADLIIPEDLAEHQAGLGQFLGMGVGAILGRCLEMRARDRDGRDFPIELTVWSTPVGSDGGLNAFVRDISERKNLEGELIRQALHDPLTGLPNRTLMLDRLGHALTRGERSGAAVTVLFLDLDAFKTINDSLGHAAGDRVLAALAERLRGALRPSDTIARIGGDEFAVLLEDTGTVDGARIAQRIGEALESPFVIDGHNAFTQASIGVATGNPGEHTADDLIRNADLAMYRAKAQGKAGYVVFESGMHLAVVERLQFEAALRQALGLGEFFLLYQPVVRLADGSVVGMEALIRWKRAGGAVVPPDQFIPVAEETGLIREIGRWVLQEACRQAAAWQSEHSPTPALRLSVNLSARQLQDPGLVKDVEAVLASSGLEPACLVIEITESLLMSEPDVAVERLGELKDLGVKLAIDDFGTGYSSLSYLRRFPVDVLKVDRSFVTALGTGPEDGALAQAIVKLGQTLRLRVVAEGIETAAQLAELRALGCEYGQGYFFARPLTPDAMSSVLADARQASGLLSSSPSPTG